jgi:hypothetical protein
MNHKIDPCYKEREGDRLTLKNPVRVDNSLFSNKKTKKKTNFNISLTNPFENWILKELSYIMIEFCKPSNQ